MVFKLEPYKIRVDENEINGWEDEICFKCDFTGDYKSIEKVIKVKQHLRDCTNSLVAKENLITFTTPYVKEGEGHVIENGYEAIFTHNDKDHCPVSECLVK